MLNIDTSYHPEWQKNRLSYILNHFGKEFFKNKSILEIGPFNAYFGASLHNLGAKILLVEGRQDNINGIKNTYPELDIIQGDVDTNKWKYGKFDIILNFGVFYHLKKHHKEHLKNCIKNCNTLIFETVVFDSDEPVIHTRNENGGDQSLSGIGGTPSTSFVENIFKEMNVKFTKHTSSKLNGGNHIYDWEDKNSKGLNDHARRMWIVEK